MTEQEQARKLEWIARLNAEELVGWHSYVRKSREFFPGEHPAILKRAKELRIEVND